MNLKGIEFINYLYILILALGTWINVNIFSSIQWFGILLYIYNVFCVDDRGKQYFKNLRFLIVFLMSFSNMVFIFHSYILYEYLSSKDQDNYYKEIADLGFEYGKNTNMLVQTPINLSLALFSFILSILVFKQLNRQENIFEGKPDENNRPTIRKTVNPQNTFQKVLNKYDWAQTFISAILVFLMMATILIDGLFGVFYSIILASWMLSKLSNQGNDLTKQIEIDQKFLQLLKYFSLLTCYCSILWKLNVFVRQYKGIVYMINGYVSSYTILFIFTFILELLLFMFTVYSSDLLSQLTPQHIQALKLKKEKNSSSSPTAFSMLITGNYFGLITASCFLWATLFPSLLMFIPLTILLIGSVGRKQKDMKLTTAILINYFSYILLVLIIIFNIPFLFKYVTGQLLFNLLGLHSYNEEEGGVDGLLDRMGFLSLYLLITLIIYWFTLLKVQQKQPTLQLHHLPHQPILHQPHQQSNISSFHHSAQIQQSEVSLPIQRIQDDIGQDIDEDASSQNTSQYRAHFDAEKSERSSQKNELKDSQIIQSASHLQSSFMQSRRKKSDDQNKQKSNILVRKLKEFWRGLSKVMLLHLEKVNVCIIFAVSIYKIDVIHTFYMIAFLVLVYSHMKYWRNIMKVVIAYSYFVIILHYTTTVLFEAKAIKSISKTFIFIGLSKNPTIATFLTEQTLEIIMVLVLTYCQANIVYVTNTYNAYRQQCIEIEDLSTSYVRKQEVIKKMDALSQFFIKYGVWVCYISLLTIGLLPPANILSLGYLVFLQIFISFTMIENHERRALQKIMKGWPLLVAISSFILIVRYGSLFPDLNDLLRQLIPKKKMLEDIGLSNELNTLQICGNAIILFILNAKKRLIDAKLYTEDENEDLQIEKEEEKQISYSVYSIRIKLLFLLSTHFSKIVLFYGLLLSILHQSIAGVIACFVQMLIFLWGRDNFWKTVWIPLWVISFTFLLTQYFYQLHFLGDNLTDQEKDWGGVFSIKTSRYWIFLVLYIFQQILCVFMRKLQKFSSKIDTDSYEKFIEDFDEIKEGYQREKIRIDNENNRELQEILIEEQQSQIQEDGSVQDNLQLSKIKSVKQDGQQYQASPLKLSSSIMSSLRKRMTHAAEQLKKEDEDIKIQKQQDEEYYQVYLQMNPFKRAVEIEYELKEFFKYYGYDLSIFVLIVAAYFEMNAVSLVHIFLAIFFAFFSYVINSHKQYSPGLLLFVNYVWRTINYLMVIDITRKYIISIWFPVDWKIEKPWEEWGFNCDKKGKNAFSPFLNKEIEKESLKQSDYSECTHDWKHWLSLEEESNLHLILDVINFQIMVIYDRYFREIYNQNGPQRSRADIKSNDQFDFTRKNDIISYLKLFIFGYFYQIAIMTYFIIGCLNNISSYTDIISIIYVFTSIYMLFQTKMLLHKKNDVWKYLLMFNTIVMCVLCLYQAPFFSCPIVYPDDRYYLNSSECLSLQNGKQGELYILDVLKREVNSSDDVYILLSHILGFNKSQEFKLQASKEVFMIFFVLFGLIQKNLWNHPYTEHYIEPYFKEQREKQKGNAVSIIEQLHFKRINASIQQQVELEVYDSIQSRVENKVVVWDKMVSNSDNRSLNRDLQEEKNLLSYDQKNEPYSQSKIAINLENQTCDLSEKQIEEIKYKSERIVLESNSKIQTFNPFIFLNLIIFQSQLFENYFMKLCQILNIFLIAKVPISLNEVVEVCTLYHNDNERLEQELENLRTKNQFQMIEMVYENKYIGITEFKETMIQQHKQRKQKIEENLKKRNIFDEQFKIMSEKKEDTLQKDQSEKLTTQEDKQKASQLLTETKSQKQEVEEEQKQHEAKEQSFTGNQKLQQSEKKQYQDSRKLILKFNEFLGNIKRVIIGVLGSMLIEIDKDTITLIKEDNSLSLMFIVFMQYKFQLVCLTSFILTAVMNGDVVSVLYPVIYFSYALVENPFPPRVFWKFIMYYTILIITLKFLYQLPVFCGSPPYTFYLLAEDQTCSSSSISLENSRTRIDFIIGIRKYMGPSSYPKNQGFFAGIFWDYIILLFLFVQRYLMQLEGKWSYIHFNKDECYVPQFRDPVAEYHKYRQQPIEEQIKQSFSLAGITDATLVSESIQEDENGNLLNNDQDFVEDDYNQNQNLSSNQIREQEPLVQIPQSINQNEYADEILINMDQDQVIHRNLIAGNLDLQRQQHSSQGDDGSNRDEVGPLNDQLNLSNSQHSYKDNEEGDNQDDTQIVKKFNIFQLFLYRLFPFYLEDYYDAKLKIEIDSSNNQKQMYSEDIIYTANAEDLIAKKEDIWNTKPGKNYYIHQFVCSFIVLIYFIIFYPQMVSSQSSINPQTNQTRFSSSIVVIILVCITVIVIDRILYKLRNIKTTFIDISNAAVSNKEKDISQHSTLFKYIMHIVLIIMTQQTHSRFSSNIHLVFCYFFVALYLYFSSLQIKNGYPTMSVGSIFSRDTSIFYRLSFILYRALPFLYELRSVIDWTFTSTSLDIFQWFKMEDAYANLYSVKAEMKVRKETHKFGQKRDFTEKCTNGFLFLVILLVVILLPIFLFSNLNPAVELNNLTTGGLRLELQVRKAQKEFNIRLYQKLNVEVQDFTEKKFNTFEELFYGVDDIWEERLQVVKIDQFSDKEHEFTPNMLKDLEEQFENPDIELSLMMDFTFQRPKPEGKETVKGKQQLILKKDLVKQFQELLSTLKTDMLKKNKIKSKSYKFELQSLIPFFQLIPDSQTSIQRPFEPSNKKDLDKYNESLPKEIKDSPQFDPHVFQYLDAELVFQMQEGTYQWLIQRKPAPYFDKIVPFKEDDNRIAFITLSEMAFSSVLRSMSDNLSVVGIYLTVVLTVGRFLRLYFNNVSMRCIWEEMPRTDDLFDLCQSIYIARLENNLIKEERNYELLIRILRSPEILMKLTGKSLYDID